MDARSPVHARHLFAALAMSVTLTAGSAEAAGIVVNTLADGSVVGACTLRDAITAANADGAVNGCAAGSGADTITFGVSGTITLGSLLPSIEDGSTLTIDGIGQTVTLSGNNVVGVLRVRPGGTLDLANMVVANANARFRPGGGLQNEGTVSITNCTFSGNHALGGGGIHNSRNATLSVSNSTFSNNTAENTSTGGGIANNGALTIGNSTFVGNRARAGGGLESLRQLTVSHSTFSGNTADGGGAGLFVFGGTITHTTIVDNTSLISGNGGLFAADVTLANTILANNSGGDCHNEREMTLSGVNLIADGSCSGPGALTGDPMLGPLADNGGPTMTHALTAASTIAIDAGDNTVCAPYATDQRGSPRKVDGDNDGSAVCDLGAYEFSALYAFSGFFAPVDNLPVVNTVKAGRAIPVKFSLGSYQGLSIFAASSPSSQQVTCDSGASAADVEQTVAAGGSSLVYDEATDTYTYVWKTDKAWAGTCRQLVMHLADGSFHLASFQLK